MKKLIVVTGMIALMIGCENKEPQPIDIPTAEIEKEPIAKTPEKQYSTEAMNKWEEYYNQNIDGFKLSDFKKGEKFKIQRSESSIEPKWSDDFKSIYEDFLIYNPDSTQYLDIDSYKWYVDDQGELYIGADQALVLVNIPEKTTETLMVYGPSYWIEDAYFKNDSTIVILENSLENVPTYQELNLKTDSTQYYIYDKPNSFDSEYLKNRINRLYKNSM